MVIDAERPADNAYPTGISEAESIRTLLFIAAVFPTCSGTTYHLRSLKQLNMNYVTISQQELNCYGIVSVAACMVSRPPAMWMYGETMTAPGRTVVIRRRINILFVIGCITLFVVVCGMSECQTTSQRQMRSQSDVLLLDRDVYRSNYSPHDDVYRPKP